MSQTLLLLDHSRALSFVLRNLILQREDALCGAVGCHRTVRRVYILMSGRKRGRAGSVNSVDEQNGGKREEHEANISTQVAPGTGRWLPAFFDSETEESNPMVKFYIPSMITVQKG